MSVHRFAIGQSVRLKNRADLSPKAAETYRIIETLPARFNTPRYRLRNDEMLQERVTTQDNLEEIQA
jgi:hypothetical protein